MNILVGDIGGTNTRLLFANMNGTACDNYYEKSYYSQNFSDLTEVIKQFFLDFDITVSIDDACFAIAGPVENGQVSVTNLPWVISEEQLESDFNIPEVKLINDFLAVAIGISELNDDDYLILQEGEISPSLVKPGIAVIGAGTGLGAAHLVWQNEHYHAYSSETGHTGFAPENILQTELLLWMQKEHSHVSLEMILSGKGLLTIYQFLHKEKGYQESLPVQDDMKLKDAAEVITEAALAEKDILCQATLDCFIEIYAAAASNVALNYYPVGELYIAGGIAAKIKDKMQEPSFIDAFTNKGLLSVNMKKIKIKLILQDKVGLYGALAMLKRTYLQ